MARSLVLADDNPGDRGLVELAIEETAWSVRIATAADGAAAMTLLESRLRDGRLLTSCCST